jgi:hypothetical protein
MHGDGLNLFSIEGPNFHAYQTLGPRIYEIKAIGYTKDYIEMEKFLRFLLSFLELMNPYV